MSESSLAECFDSLIGAIYISYKILHILVFIRGTSVSILVSVVSHISDSTNTLGVVSRISGIGSISINQQK